MPRGCRHVSRIGYASDETGSAMQMSVPLPIGGVRLDGGFAAPEVLDFLESQPGLEYVVNMASNKVLDRRVEPAMAARRLSEESGKTEHVYGDFRYKTEKTWQYKRRIIDKAEVVHHPGRDPKDNPRFVITNMKQMPQWTCEEVYG
jgi:Transposase DDE domain group 1